MSSAREFVSSIREYFKQHPSNPIAAWEWVVKSIEARDTALLRDERARLNEVRKLANEWIVEGEESGDSHTECDLANCSRRVLAILDRKESQ